MNGLSSISGTNAAAPTSADAVESSNFDQIFQEGVGNMTAVMFQMLGGDIIESVMKDENAVD